MNECDDVMLEPEEQLLLGRARRALGPTPAEQDRVLAQLLPGLGGALSAPPAPQASSAAAGVSGHGLRYFWGLLALGVAGMAGYGWGYQAGARAQVASAVAPLTTPSVVSPPAEPAMASGHTRGASAPTPALEAAPAPAAVPAPAAASGPATAAQRASSLASSVAIAGSAPAGLDEEVRQLRRIERAIRDGNPRLALVIGEDLDRTIPRGQLLLERRAASVMAECQLEASGARARAQRLIDESSNSAYTARVREMCKLPERPQRNRPAVGTDSTEEGGAR